MTTYKVEGGGTVSLTDRNFIAKGGEGSFFIKDWTGYKIGKMPPLDKIEELKKLSTSNRCVAPQRLLMDKSGLVVGYSMRVADGVPWCLLYTPDGANLITSLLDATYSLKEVFHTAHSSQFLIVDANENNFLVDKKNFVTGIDLNSWQTNKYPATAIMPSIRDWTSQSFSEETDWYSFAVLAFSAWTFIHPYKGKHPKYNGSIVDRIKSRCQDHISVFNPDVSIPQTVRSPDSIPQGLRSWLYDVLEKGKRGVPPKDFEKGGLQVPKKKTTFLNGQISLDDFEEPAKKAHLKGRKLQWNGSDLDIFFDFLIETPKLYGINGRKVFLLEDSGFSAPIRKHVSTVVDVGNLKYFRGCLYWNVLGHHFFMLDGKNKQIPIPDTAKVLDASYFGGVLCVSYTDGFSYFVEVFNTDGKSILKKEDLVYHPSNFTKLDSGVCVLRYDDSIILFSEKSSSEKLIQAQNVPPGQLRSFGAKLIIGNKLAKLK